MSNNSLTASSTSASSYSVTIGYDGMSFVPTPQKIRGFEKVSFGQYKSDYLAAQREELKSLRLPTRATTGSAGYDFYAPYDITIPVDESVTVITGIKAYMKEDEYLEIVPRSSLGFKFGIGIANTVGIIDSDYYNNENNQGEIMVKLVNRGTTEVTIGRGKAFCQGIFKKYLLADNDEPWSVKRDGGIGSTSKE